MKLLTPLATLVIVAAAPLSAQVVNPVSITGHTTFYNATYGTNSPSSLLRLVDGVFAPETTNWQDPRFNGSEWVNGYAGNYFPVGTGNATPAGGSTLWWTANNLDTSAVENVWFSYNFGSVFELTGLSWSVDNNDSYWIEYSLDGLTFTPLLTLSSAAGEIGWGMDTLTSDSGDAEYDAAMVFSPVTAQYVRFGGTGGDGLYAISEVRLLGNVPGAVPEPSTYGLIGAAALAGAVVLRRRKRA